MAIEHPADPETVRRWLRLKAERIADPRPPSPAQVGLLAGLLAQAFAYDAAEGKVAQTFADNARHGLLDFVFGVRSSKQLTMGQAKALLDWLVEGQNENGGYTLNEVAAKEARAIYNAFLEQQGQMELWERRKRRLPLLPREEEV